MSAGFNAADISYYATEERFVADVWVNDGGRERKHYEVLSEFFFFSEIQ